MKNLLVLSCLIITLLGCEDKVIEPTTTYVTTPAACPPTNPELKPSPINFDGLDEITNITSTSLRLNWKPREGLQFYYIILIAENDRKIIKTLEAEDSSWKISGLSPDTEYSYLVRSLDTKGYLDQNNNVRTVKTHPWPTYTNRVSLNLNGSQSIQLAPSQQYDLKEVYTASIWFKTNTKSSPSDTRLFTFHKDSKQIASTALSVGFENDTIQVQINGIEIIRGKVVAYADNKWHQIALVVNKRKISLYMDGKKLLKFRAKIPAFGTHPASLGSLTGIRKAFIGHIDEFSLFTKDFSPSEIKELFKNGDTFDLKSHSQAKYLLHWYRLGDSRFDSIKNIEDIITGLNGAPGGITESDFSTDVP
ncbi:MAG: hypothetical protein HON90_07955 [Halobacteriovoraceae bacterium]|jgi:hypothetical protein|nr:hypothetical protein [Halobacteriovoraceae bacterium]